MTQTPESRIGILGGSFDPVHFGHLAVAQLAYEHLKLEKVYFIPSGIPPHKVDKVIVSAFHRLKMLQSAIKGKSHFIIWDEEIKRGGISYIIDTLKSLKEQHPDSIFYFIIGSDNFFEILTWHRYKKIIKMVTLCVAHRPGYSMRIPPELSSAKIIHVPSPEWGISSTKIRSYIANNLSCRHIIPKSVIDYIHKNNFYKS